jgi:RNA polymerase sigma factor (sigma-70 family)
MQSTTTEPDWARMAKGIRADDGSAVKEFYEVFNRGFRFFISRQLGSVDLEDNVHDCVLAVMTAVRREQLREPERFVGFVRTIVKRYIAARIKEKISGRADENIDEARHPLRYLSPDPERNAIRTETRAIARQALETLSGRDREVLRRFYLLEQKEEQIRLEMNLSEHAFKNIKHRAKNKFAEKWHNLANRGITSGVAGGVRGDSLPRAA